MAKDRVENEIFHVAGAGGHAKVVIDILRNQKGNDCVIKIYDDDVHKLGQQFYYYPVVGPISSVIPNTTDCIVAIGDNSTRKKIARMLHERSCTFFTAIHPTAILAESVMIGNGTVVMAGVKVNADAQIGNHCILNTASVIEHDCSIGDFVHIAPSVTMTGNVTVGEGTFIGANATIIPGIKIGKWCIIGAGSVVLNDIPDFSVAYGVPAKVIKRNERYE